MDIMSVDIINEDNTRAHSVNANDSENDLHSGNRPAGEQIHSARKSKKAQSYPRQFFNLSWFSYHVVFPRKGPVAFPGEMGYGSLVSFGHFLVMDRFSLLSSLLSDEQRSALRAVQVGLAADPTCLDRAPTETVPNCYTEGASLPTAEEQNDA